MMKFLDRLWHKIAGQKSTVIRVIDHVATQLEKSDENTLEHLNNAFHPASQDELEGIRTKVAQGLRSTIENVKNEHHSKDDSFESHDQCASLAQSTLNEQLATLEVEHTGIGDNVDAFFNKYGTGDLGGWVPVFLKIVAEKVHLQHKSPFVYFDPTDRQGLVTNIPEVCKVILVADWGANNDHAANIRDLIKTEIANTTVPVYFIHLGDIYYSGTRSECQTFLKNWPLRDAGGPIKGRSFALNGNHEMYSGGDGYFGTVLPQLGQPASYFALRSPKWDFYGLDVAYVPGRFYDPSEANLTHQWQWLKNQMDGATDRRHVLLTHNQPCSANLPEHDAGLVMRQQIAELQEGNVRPIEGWFFGHQHKCYIYEDTRLNYKARLIGHGSFPHDIQKEKYPDNDLNGNPLMAFAQLDYRGYPSGLAYSGYVSIDVTNEELLVRYIDEDGKQFHEEGWMSHSST
jgi:hypothetical protein